MIAIVGATIGKVCQVPTEFETFTIQRSVALLRTKPERMESRFLLHFISSAAFQNEIRLKTNTTAQPGLYLAQIGEFLAPRPDLDEQRRICAVLDSCVARIAATEQHLSKLHSLKRGLAQDLLTGRVRVRLPSKTGNAL